MFEKKHHSRKIEIYDCVGWPSIKHNYFRSKRSQYSYWSARYLLNVMANSNTTWVCATCHVLNHVCDTRRSTNGRTKIPLRIRRRIWFEYPRIRTGEYAGVRMNIAWHPRSSNRKENRWRRSLIEYEWRRQIVTINEGLRPYVPIEIGGHRTTNRLLAYGVTVH